MDLQLDIRDAFTPDELAEHILSNPDDHDALNMAWDLANMAGLEFTDDKSLAKELADLDGDLLLATVGVIKRQAVRKDLVFFNDSDLGLALAHPAVWEAVIKEIRDTNVSLFYKEREFLWLS